MKLKRLLALSLASALALSLAACGGEDPAGTDSGAAGTGSTDTGSTDTGSTGAGSAGDIDYAGMAAGYTQELAGLDPDQILFTVNGQDVPAKIYLYWLTYDCYYWDYMNTLYYGAGLDFTADTGDGTTMADYLREDARSFAAYYIIMEQLAQENQCPLTDDQLAEWEAQKADYIAANGQDGYDLLLAQYGMDQETFDRINTYAYLYENLKGALVGEPTEDDLAAYIEENDILMAKHILIRTATEDEEGNLTFATGDAVTNADGTAYTGTAEEYNTDAKARVDTLLTRLEESDDPLTLFNELMNTYSEDPGLASYPDGYIFTAGEMVSEFEEGTRALEYDEISGAVQSPHGYHIILRLKPDVSADFATTKLDSILETALMEAEIVSTGDAFDAIDTAAVYSNHLAYQERLSALASGGTGTDTGSTGSDTGSTSGAE